VIYVYIAVFTHLKLLVKIQCECSFFKVKNSERSPLLISDQRERGSPGVCGDAVAECDALPQFMDSKPNSFSGLWLKLQEVFSELQI